MRIGSLFSGYGGLDLGVQAAIGGTTAWVSDIDPGACKILAHRWPDVPNLGDITAVDWAQVEPVDVLTGGFPCQDLSLAGKGAGLKPGTRSGLWSHMATAVSILRPRLVVAENVRGILSATADSDVECCAWCVGGAGDGEPALRALGAVLGDLADIGYDARWVGLRASDIGAPHARLRVFIVAADANRVGSERAGVHRSGEWGWPEPAHGGVVAADPDGGGLECVGRVDPVRCDAHGCSHPDGSRDGAEPATPGTDWGDYGPAVHRWARRLGRPAPSPTEPGRTGDRLSPRFVEWMMGLPDGWVTGVPGLTRADQLKALGNGVVPQQAEAAIRDAIGGAW